MAEIFSDFFVVAGSVVSLFLMMAVGFVLTRRGILEQSALSQLSQLLLKVVAPCIVISSLQTDFSPELLTRIGMTLLALVLLYAAYALLVRFLFSKQPEDSRCSLRFGVMFGNVGFMGLPLATAALGQEAVIYCAVNLALFNAANWTYGVHLMGQPVSPRRALLNPGVLGALAGCALFLLRIRLPGPVLSAVEYMGDLNTPLAMVVIGGQMAAADLPATFRNRKLYWAAALKLIVIPLLSLLLLLPFRSDGMLFLTLAILAGCPTAGATSMFAQLFQKDTATAAQLVTLSTLLSVVTLPLMALIARQFAG